MGYYGNARLWDGYLGFCFFERSLLIDGWMDGSVIEICMHIVYIYTVYIHITCSYD